MLQPGMIDWLRTLTSFERVGDGPDGERRRRLLRRALFVLGFVLNLAIWYAVGRLVEARIR